jgi:hypothetical protein
MAPSAALHVGLIADTHGLLRPEALAALRGSDHIIHAGDICDAAVLAALEQIAPVTAVRGNNDKGPWAASLHETQVLQLGEVRLYVIHDLAELDLDPAAGGFQAVISGHSHKPRCETRNGVLYVNPGSAGPRRFSLPVSVGMLEIVGGQVSARLLHLELRPSPGRAKRG